MTQYNLRYFYNTLLFTVILVFLTNCGRKTDLGEFDKQAWKKDRYGCDGERKKLIEDLKPVKQNLLGLYQKAIIQFLGQPEDQELYKRSQTYYIYYIDPSDDCTASEENPRKLEVRFTALGIANEVNIK